MKSEVLIASREMALKIADEVAVKFFDGYSVLAYLCDAEVLYAHKF
jgi:hypothetical protein